MHFPPTLPHAPSPSAIPIHPSHPPSTLQVLTALAASEAAEKLQIHHLVKVAFRRLTDGPPPPAATQSMPPLATQPSSAPKQQKRKARSFHNFCSERGKLKGHGQSLTTLQRCHSSIRDDLRGAAAETHVPHASTDAGTWGESDCLVLSFAARDFAPHQVRRMAATVAAVVSGALPPTFIDACFKEGAEVRTPLAPAEAMWLEQVQTAPRAEKAWAKGLPSLTATSYAMATAASRESAAASAASAVSAVSAAAHSVAADSVAAGASPLVQEAEGRKAEDISSAAVLAECAAMRAAVVEVAAREARMAAARGWLGHELRHVPSA